MDYKQLYEEALDDKRVFRERCRLLHAENEALKGGVVYVEKKCSIPDYLTVISGGKESAAQDAQIS